MHKIFRWLCHTLVMLWVPCCKRRSLRCVFFLDFQLGIWGLLGIRGLGTSLTLSRQWSKIQLNNKNCIVKLIQKNNNHEVFFLVLLHRKPWQLAKLNYRIFYFIWFIWNKWFWLSIWWTYCHIMRTISYSTSFWF